MLYYLFDLMQKYNLPGARLMNYVSFRALLTIVLSLIISAWSEALSSNSSRRSRLPRHCASSTRTTSRQVSPQWAASS